MEDLINLFNERFSARSFSNQKVEQEKIDKILEAARIAPTACNKQPQRILVIQSDKALETLQKCKFSHFNEQLAFIICYDQNECWQRKVDNKKSGEVDASIVATHMMLEATSLGLGSTWVMSFMPEVIKEEFKLEENIIPSAILVMGYKSDDCKPSDLHSTKKEVKDFVKYL